MIKEYPNGLTIKELKEFINSLPDEMEDGEPYEVWIESGAGLSNVVKRLAALNHDGYGSDICLMWNI